MQVVKEVTKSPVPLELIQVANELSRKNKSFSNSKIVDMGGGYGQTLIIPIDKFTHNELIVLLTVIVGKNFSWSYTSIKTANEPRLNEIMLWKIN